VLGHSPLARLRLCLSARARGLRRLVVVVVVVVILRLPWRRRRIGLVLGLLPRLLLSNLALLVPHRLQVARQEHQAEHHADDGERQERRIAQALHSLADRNDDHDDCGDDLAPEGELRRRLAPWLEVLADALVLLGRQLQEASLAARSSSWWHGRSGRAG
jgi:hypothetical protein